MRPPSNNKQNLTQHTQVLAFWPAIIHRIQPLIPRSKIGFQINLDKSRHWHNFKIFEMFRHD